MKSMFAKTAACAVGGLLITGIASPAFAGGVSVGKTAGGYTSKHASGAMGLGWAAAGDVSYVRFLGASRHGSRSDFLGGDVVTAGR